MKTVSAFLTVLALVVGMIGCESTSIQCELTITSTGGGSVTEPGEGTFTYDKGTMVNLAAEAEEGYRFVMWTINSCPCYISNISAASTSVNMSGNYSIVANFISANSSL